MCHVVDSHVLPSRSTCSIVAGVTKMDVAAFAQQRLFAPLGMTDTKMTTDRTGHAQMFEGLRSTCRDLARFGTLFLNRGQWGAKRIVSMEENYSGQLAQVVQEQTGVMIDQRVNKFDGRPFSEDEIVNALAKVYDGAKAEPVVTHVH